jgi:ArsR family transcriptional regulator
MKDLANVIKGCADINRLRILKLLQRKPMCVCELRHILGVTQPAISRHLKKLQKAGLIASEQDGLWRNYFLHGENEYSRGILKNISKWCNRSPIIRADRKKADATNRTKICNK